MIVHRDQDVVARAEPLVKRAEVEIDLPFELRPVGHCKLRLSESRTCAPLCCRQIPHRTAAPAPLLAGPPSICRRSTPTRYAQNQRQTTRAYLCLGSRTSCRASRSLSAEGLVRLYLAVEITATCESKRKKGRRGSCLRSLGRWATYVSVKEEQSSATVIAPVAYLANPISEVAALKGGMSSIEPVARLATCMVSFSNIFHRTHTKPLSAAMVRYQSNCYLPKGFKKFHNDVVEFVCARIEKLPAVPHGVGDFPVRRTGWSLRPSSMHV